MERVLHTQLSGRLVSISQNNGLVPVKRGKHIQAMSFVTAFFCQHLSSKTTSPGIEKSITTSLCY
jgi:hypothetical protein